MSLSSKKLLMVYSDIVMLQVMEECTRIHFANNPKRVFDFSGIEYPPEEQTAPQSVPVAEVPSPEVTSPAESSAEDATSIIIDAINALGATSIKDMGKVMADVKPKLADKLDGGKIGELVKKILSAGPPFVAKAAAPDSTQAPSEMSSEDASKIIVEAIKSVGASNIKDMGKVMAEVKPKLTGKFDMGKLSELVKSTLNAGPPFGPPIQTTKSESTVAAASTSALASDTESSELINSESLVTAVKETVARLGATSLRDMSRVMSELKTQLAGRVDPGKLSEAVKKILSEGPAAAASTPASGDSSIAAPSAVVGADSGAVDVTTPLSEQEVITAVKDAIGRLAAAGMKDMGKVMAEMKPIVQGRFDMSKLSELVKRTLTESSSSSSAVVTPSESHGTQSTTSTGSETVRNSSEPESSNGAKEPLVTDSATESPIYSTVDGRSQIPSDGSGAAVGTERTLPIASDSSVIHGDTGSSN